MTTVIAGKGMFACQVVDLIRNASICVANALLPGDTLNRTFHPVDGKEAP